VRFVVKKNEGNKALVAIIIDLYLVGLLILGRSLFGSTPSFFGVGDIGNGHKAESVLRKPFFKGFFGRAKRHLEPQPPPVDYTPFTIKVNHYQNCSQTRECVQLIPTTMCPLPFRTNLDPRSKLFLVCLSCV
jgi:hypothetical protein